jgi:tetratricopeptide (TPR) repeat protein
MRVFVGLSWLAGSVMLSGCAKDMRADRFMPSDSTVGGMSVRQARVAFAAAYQGFLVGDFKDYKLAIASNKISVVGPGKTFVLVPVLSEMGQVSVSDGRLWITDGAGNESVLFSRAGTPQAANALYVLKQEAIRQRKENLQADAMFTASLADYRAKAASIPMPEEAMRYKVQAEGAVRDKDFHDAADRYAAALKIVPWWPAGHFNRALVLGEIGDYEAATREMGYYLKLAPDAANARAAQDKIYEWERLDGR